MNTKNKIIATASILVALLGFAGITAGAQAEQLDSGKFCIQATNTEDATVTAQSLGCDLASNPTEGELPEAPETEPAAPTTLIVIHGSVTIPADSPYLGTTYHVTVTDSHGNVIKDKDGSTNAGTGYGNTNIAWSEEIPTAEIDSYESPRWNVSLTIEGETYTGDFPAFVLEGDKTKRLDNSKSTTWRMTFENGTFHPEA